MNDPAISLRGVSKRFGRTVALEPLDLVVPVGAALGLLGPSGAGKSTLVRIVAGLVRPTGGSVEILGERLHAGDGVAARRRLGVALQSPGLPGWATVRELLALVASLAGLPAAEVTANIEETAARFGLAPHLDRRVEALPAGAPERLRIAQAFVGDPEVIVLDEPFRALDPEARQEVRGVLREGRGSSTIVIATHRVADVEGLCDRVALLVGGRLVADATTDEFLARHAPAVHVVEVAGSAGLALDGLVARLRGAPWVAEAAVVQGALRVAATDDARAERDLVPAVVSAGLAVTGYRRARPALDSIAIAAGEVPAATGNAPADAPAA